MHEEHPIFIPPANADQIIWRYIDFTKYVDLLNTGCLYFARADFFQDIFEGAITKPVAEMRTIHYERMVQAGKIKAHYTEEFWRDYNFKSRKDYAMNCWHMNDYESAAMWRLYLKSNEGIAIQSTYRRLSKSFNDSDTSIQIGVVNYVDYDKDVFDFGNVFSPFLHKRKSFEHEKELRCILWKWSFVNSGVDNLEKGGVKIKVSMADLIENIYVSPDSPTWLTELVEDITRKYSIAAPVINSRLNDKPLF